MANTKKVMMIVKSYQEVKTADYAMGYDYKIYIQSNEMLLFSKATTIAAALVGECMNSPSPSAAFDGSFHPQSRFGKS